MIDPNRQRIQEDLRGLVHGDVHCDDITLQLYSSDASIYQIKPLGVVRPRRTEDVAAVLKYAYANQIPVHARGAGTGLAGESLGAGVIIDFSRYMRRVVETGPDWVRIQPGVVHARLNEHLKTFGRTFGPDPAMSQVTTMGSVIAVNASGSHYLQYRAPREHIINLEVVLADGTILNIGQEDVAMPPLAIDASPMMIRRHELIQQLELLLDHERETIDRHQAKFETNHPGYHLTSILRDGKLDLPKLICGSEGTLALITEMTVATQPLPRHKVAALLLFGSMEQAVQAVPELLPLGPCALDLLDRRHLSLAREAEPRYNPLVPQETEGLLLIEFAGDDLAELQNSLRRATDLVWKQKQLAFDAKIAADHEELRFFWRLVRRVTPTLQKIQGSARPIAFVEDVVVPPAELANFLVVMQNTLKRHQVTASLYGHVGHGQLHIRPLMDLNNPTDVGKLDAMATDLYSETIALGGTIGGEHGDGLSRSPFIRQQYAELYPVFQQVKRIFDPLSILNPGKIICEEKIDLATNMRSGWTGNKSNAPEVFRTISTTETVTERPDDGNIATLAPPNSTIATPPLIDLHLNWNQADILNETKSCNGCGVCRTQLPDQRMCPIFRIGPGEEASPRAKANAMRGILTGELDPQSLKREEMKEVADLCVNCQQCRFECPAGVDIPKLMIEAKAGYVTTNGLGWRNWFLANIDRLASWASSFATVVNWTLRNRQMRWLFERLAGLAHNRKLPRFSNYTFTRWASRRKLTRTSRRTERKVLYFADTYVNYFDPQLGQAFTLVCEHNGVSVYVPPEPLHSSMPQITAGAIETVRKDVTRLISRLADSVRQGYTIVATEPSTVVCLTQHYPAILDDEDSRLVAKNTFEACDYLWRIHQQGELQLDLRPIHATVGYHLPCHSRATHSGSPAEQLMRLITGLQVQRIEKGCSGMAGTYGLSKENFRNSLRAGRDMIAAMREATIQVGATECSACKMQMEQGAAKRTIHPLKWLANSYGLMPELDDIWNRRVDERVVS